MKKNKIEVKISKSRLNGVIVLTLIALFLLLIPLVTSVPTAPSAPTYVSNSTFTSGIVNRSQDAKGTITTIRLSSEQQDYKWKAYVGNVSGTLSLSDANSQTIYDWSLGTPTGEVYVSRFSNIVWSSIACVDQTSVNAEQTALGMSLTVRDNINATFNYTNHAAFTTATIPINGCRSTATYVNDNPQVMSSSASFQEILLRDTSTGNMVYSTIINASTTGYNGQTYDFQLIVGENESASSPSVYYFWVELG